MTNTFSKDEIEARLRLLEQSANQSLALLSKPHSVRWRVLSASEGGVQIETTFIGPFNFCSVRSRPAAQPDLESELIEELADDLFADGQITWTLPLE